MHNISDTLLLLQIEYTSMMLNRSTLRVQECWTLANVLGLYIEALKLYKPLTGQTIFDPLLHSYRHVHSALPDNWAQQNQ